jgi:hypothetical protein
MNAGSSVKSACGRFLLRYPQSGKQLIRAPNADVPRLQKHRKLLRVEGAITGRSVIAFRIISLCKILVTGFDFDEGATNPTWIKI